MKLTLLLAVLSLAPLVAQAQSEAGVGLKIVSATGNFCMDVTDNKKADSTKVQLYPCKGTENQLWTVTTSMRGGSAIIGTGGYCLDVRGYSRTPGAAVQIFRCHFGGNQLFRVGSDGTIKEASSGDCLQAASDKPGAAVTLAACKGTPLEKWHFEK